MVSGFPSESSARPRPAYIQYINGQGRISALKIWQLNTLSNNPCRGCRTYNVECWVAPWHGTCARCSASGFNIKTCRAGGTRGMLAPAGQSSGSRISAVGGNEAVVSNREPSGNEESLDPNLDAKASLGHAPTTAPTMTNRSLPCSTNETTNDPSTVPTKRVVNRSLPYYTCDRKNPQHEAAHKIWQADTLSCDPCAVCKALKIDCWVDGEYSSCARCTASQQHEGICNAVGTKDAHQDLEEPSSLRQQEHGNPTSDQPGEENTTIGITSGSATSNDIGSNTQRPARFPKYIDAREQPDYAIPSRTYTHVTAHKIWLANRLSTDPCKPCQDAELDCWVESKHVACARCTSFQRTAKQCGAKGTKSNPVDKG